MGIKYCNLCERKVEPKREIGIGSLILVLITGGLWILVLLFYQERCPVCKASGLTNIRTKTNSTRLPKQKSNSPIFSKDLQDKLISYSSSFLLIICAVAIFRATFIGFLLLLTASIILLPHFRKMFKVDLKPIFFYFSSLSVFILAMTVSLDDIKDYNSGAEDRALNELIQSFAQSKSEILSDMTIFISNGELKSAYDIGAPFVKTGDLELIALMRKTIVTENKHENFTRQKQTNKELNYEIDSSNFQDASSSFEVKWGGSGCPDISIWIAQVDLNTENKFTSNNPLNDCNWIEAGTMMSSPIQTYEYKGSIFKSYRHKKFGIIWVEPAGLR
jgi:hypothetical protein